MYTILFSFVMPPGIAPTDDQASYPCRPFPPSFRLHRLASSLWDPRPLPDIYITYIIQASITHHCPEPNGWATKELQVGCPIEFLPYIDAQPPIETRCFPDEFVLAARSTAWKYIFGKKLGSVTVQTKEPQPLRYTSDQASTDCTFRVTFDSNAQDTHHLRITAVEIQPVLYIKWYYGSEKLEGTPRKDRAGEGGPLRLHSDVIDLDKHTISDLQWSRELARDAQSPPGYQAATSAEFERRLSLDVGDVRSESDALRTLRTNGSTGEVAYETWQTDLTIRAAPPLRLLPTFYANFVALSYSLVYRISIVGIHTKRIYLSTPLQVAYPCCEQPRNSDSTDTRTAYSLLGSLGCEEACCVSVASDLHVDHVSTEYFWPIYLVDRN